LKLTVIFVIIIFIIAIISFKEVSALHDNGAGLLVEKCTLCHDLNLIKGEKKTSADWADTIAKMRAYGVNITDKEASILTTYLSTAYGLSPPLGLHLVGQRCTQCHSLERITTHRMSPADWEFTLSKMRSYGADLTEGEEAVVLEYLAANFAAPKSGATIAEEKCTSCHDIDVIQKERKTAQEWSSTLDAMLGFGANLTKDEGRVLLEYLTGVYGAAPVTGPSLLEERCVKCHSTERIITQKKSPAEWEAALKKMLGYGAELSDEEFNVLLKYLIGKFTTPSTGPSLLENKCASCHALSMVTAQKKTPEDWEATLERMKGYGVVLTGDESEILHHFLTEEYGLGVLDEEKEEIQELLQEVEVKAAYNETHVFLRFQWQSDEGKYHDYLVYKGGTWTTEMPSHEDMFNVMLDDGGVENFAQAGCFVACHSDPRSPEQVTKYVLETRFGLDLTKIKSEKVLKDLRSKGGFLDLWNWRASSTNPIGYADDQEVFKMREGDEGEGPYYPNWDDSLKQPKFMYDSKKTGHAAFRWEELKKQEYYYISEDIAAPFDASRQWREGDAIPKVILRAPKGSRGDVNARGTWKANTWTLEMWRRLDTGNYADDKTLIPGHSYTLTMSLHNNSVFRSHYVSFPLSLGLGVKGDITAVHIAGDKPDWEEIDGLKVTLFAPGAVTWEVATSGTWHPFKKHATITGEAKCSNCHVEPRAREGLATCKTCMTEKDIALLATGQHPEDRWWYAGYSEVSGEYSETNINEVREFRDYVKSVCGPSLLILFSALPLLFNRKGGKA
jgi:cytochrome c2